MQRISLIAAAGLLAAGCGTAEPAFELKELPTVDQYCLAAQRVVTRTEQPVKVVIHDDFDAFVKSKAVIEGPEIQQFNWRDPDGNVVGISCKLKAADHLNLQFGEGTAGPDGNCQDMNRAVFELVAPRDSKPAYAKVVFEPRETVYNEEEPGMTGPDWLAPYTATWVDDAGTLHIRAKGFQVNFLDPQFAEAPARFRGIHYCHFLAPAYLGALMRGQAPPGIEIGRKVEPMGDGGMRR